MLILLIDIDIVDSVDDNVVNFGVIDGVFFDLILLYLDVVFSDLTLDVDWVNEEVWKRVIIDGWVDVVVDSTWSSVLCVVVVVELQNTIGEITCTLQHKLWFLQLFTEHDIRSGDGREQYIVTDVVQLHWHVLSHIFIYSSPLPVDIKEVIIHSDKMSHI